MAREARVQQALNPSPCHGRFTRQPLCRRLFAAALLRLQWATRFQPELFPVGIPLVSLTPYLNNPHLLVGIQNSSRRHNSSSLAPPAPADGFIALTAKPGGSSRAPRRFSTGIQLEGGIEVEGRWAGDIYDRGNTCCGTGRRKRRRSATSTGGEGGGHTMAFDNARGQRQRQRVQRGERRVRQALPLPRSGRTGVVQMAAIGDAEADRGDYDAVQQEFSGEKSPYRVIFMRHGESEWNRDNRFLGWADIDLTRVGEREARKAAETLTDSGTHVDEVFCSYLKRSIKSAWILADELDQAWMPINCDWRLNEQMYGALTGLNKRATAERYGVELTQKWRRSYDTAPPAVPGGRGYFPEGDPKYAALTQDDIPDSWCGSPNTESLKDAQTRSWMFWRERVVPSIRDGKTVLICAHGNIIRAMLKRLDCIPNDPLKELSIPRAVPLVYDLDEDLIPIRSSTHASFGPLRGHFLGDPEELSVALEREGLQLGPVPVRSVGAVGFGAATAAAVVPSPSSTIGPTEEHEQPVVL